MTDCTDLWLRKKTSLAIVKVIVLILFFGQISGCAFIQPTRVPIESYYYNYDKSNSILVVLLPGFGDLPEQFVTHGTVEQIMACRPEVNILGVNSHFGYYRESIIVDRLQEDIIAPARASGIEQIWLLGISMGGLGSLITQREHPDEIQSVIVMAPYIGEWDEISEYISDPEKAAQSIRPEFINLWQWLSSKPKDEANITLAFGEDDHLNSQHRWFASLLGDSRVVKAPGAHKWAVWKTLWPQALHKSGMCE